MKKNEIIKDRLEEWVESKGFLSSRFTIIELCKIIGINRTYLSNYINNTYGSKLQLMDQSPAHRRSQAIDGPNP